MMPAEIAQIEPARATGYGKPPFARDFPIATRSPDRVRSNGQVGIAAGG